MMKNIITISRQYGAGGSKLGHLLSKELNIPLYNHQLLTEIGKMTGIDENILRVIDENADRQRTSKLLDYIPEEAQKILKTETVFDTNSFYTMQEKTIRVLAEKGPCIFIGRQADFALKDREDVLSIFLYGDKEYRIDRMVKRTGKSEEEIAQELRRIDKERRNYCKYYTRREWGDYRNYDYSFNCATLSMEKISEIILQEVKCYA